MPRQDNDWARYTPFNSTGAYDIPTSGYKNMRFNVPVSTTYQVKDHDMSNLPGIAFTIYRDTSMWRVILAYNGIEDALQDVYAGLVLQIPDKSAVIAYLSKNAATAAPVTLTL